MSRPAREVSKVDEKRFTVDQANRTLPLVRRIAQDIVDGYRDLHQIRREHDQLKGKPGGEASPGDGESVKRLEREAERHQERIEDCLAELELVGCQMKDFEIGLIDFPSEKEGKPILLCWKLGENDVRWWHSLEAGVRGRQPIDG